MSTTENWKKLGDFKYKVGEYFGSDLTDMKPEDKEEITIQKAEMIREGIGCVIKVKHKSRSYLAVLEDIDFNDDHKRYIFTYYDKDNDKLETIDTDFDNKWEIVKDINR